VVQSFDCHVPKYSSALQNSGGTDLIA
jgi:hypothetical protein